MNNLLTRMKSQFEAQYEVVENGCWIWTGPIKGTGYGTMRIFGGSLSAHRFSYELHVGSVPEGLILDHLCRNRACVNYEHLEAVTHRENILRGEGQAAQNARKTHYDNGHPLEGDNLYIASNGSRQCRECGRTNARRYHTRTRRAAGVPERVVGPRSKKFAEIGA